MSIGWKSLVVVGIAAVLALGSVSASGVGPKPQPDGRTDEADKWDAEREAQQFGHAKELLELLLTPIKSAQTVRDERKTLINEMMDRTTKLRLQQVDLQAAIERKEVDGHHLEVRDLQRALIDVEHDLRRSQLEMESAMVAMERDSERQEMMTMSDRLEYVATWRDLAFDAPQAVMLATQSIVELYLGADDMPGAVKELEGLLDRVEEVGSRTAIRFALKDIYVELGQFDRAAKHMVRVVIENTQGEESR